MFLVLAVKQGCGHRIASLLKGLPEGPVEADMVTETAPVLSPLQGACQEVFEIVPFIKYNGEAGHICQHGQGIAPSGEFREGMYVRVVEVAVHLVPLLPQCCEGIDRAGGATGVYEDFHCLYSTNGTNITNITAFTGSLPRGSLRNRRSSGTCP